MYEMISKPLVRRTLATLRSAEFGFFGVVVYTLVHTPRRCGQPFSAGLLLFARASSRGLRTNWLIVGISDLCEAFHSSRAVVHGSMRRPASTFSGRSISSSPRDSARPRPRQQETPCPVAPVDPH